MRTKYLGTIASKFTFFSACFIFTVLACFFAYNYSSEKKGRKEQFDRECGFLVKSYSPLVSRAAGFNDDLALIGYVQNIMEQPNVLYAMALDAGGRVLAHNKASELGRVYDDDLTRRKLNSQKLEIYPYRPADSRHIVYDVSFPLMSAGRKIGVLRVGFSTQEMAADMDKYAESNAALGAVILLIFSSGIYFFTSALLSPVARLRGVMEDLGQLNFPEDLRSARQDELGELTDAAAHALNALRQEYGRLESNCRQKKNRLNLYLKNIGACFEKGVVLTDEENKIVYCNGPAKEVLFAIDPNMLGRHILEVTRNTELIDTLKVSSENSNQVISRGIKGKGGTLNIVTVKDADGSLVGTIIMEK